MLGLSSCTLRRLSLRPSSATRQTIRPIPAQTRVARPIKEVRTLLAAFRRSTPTLATFALPSRRSIHLSVTTRCSANINGESSETADQRIAPLPFIPAVLPNLPLVVPRESYSIFEPVRGPFWPCIGMHCPETNGKHWIVVDSFVPAVKTTVEKNVNTVNEDAVVAGEAGAEEVEASEGSPSLDSISTNLEAELDSIKAKYGHRAEAKNWVWALYIEPIPEGLETVQHYGNLFQSSPLTNDRWMVTHMRRGWICPQTGNLEIARMEPGKDKYSIRFVWPKSEPLAKETESKLKDAEADEILNLLRRFMIRTDGKTSTPPEDPATATSEPTKESDDQEIISKTPLQEEGESSSSETPEAEISAVSDSSAAAPTSDEPKEYVPEASLPWPIEPRLATGMLKIREILKDAVVISPSIDVVLRSVNWEANTAYEVSHELDRITWLLNDSPTPIGDGFSKMMKASEMMWRMRFFLNALKNRFIADRYGLTTTERRKHMQALLKTLNESPWKAETRAVVERYNALAKHLPDTIREEVLVQIQKLNQPGSTEASGTTKRILDFILELPWNTASIDVIDLEAAKAILDKNHYGMEDVKERVLELLAINKLTGKFARGKVLALLGPPGTGKTTIASSIAESLGRKFGQISIGGLWDVSDLKGHRRTYLASMAGMLLRTINQCGTNNPVILLDEIDKLAPGSQVSTALLEILDPSQQSSFTDIWMDLPFDISNVLFICTANWEESIHPALRDRLEVVTMEGYLENEKFEIAKRHLLPKCLKNAGLENGEVTMTDEAIQSLVKHYSPLSPGVRDLDTQLQAIVNTCSLEIAQNTSETPLTYNLTATSYEKYLPHGEFHRYEHEKSPAHPGCASALTQLGVQQIEVLASPPSDTPGSGTFHVTGNLDEVMKESSQIAYTYITNAVRNAAAIDSSAKGSKVTAAAQTKSSRQISPEVSSYFSNRTLHIHFPRGGQSKQGVHAGACIALSLLSLALNKPVPDGWAISGELTLHGKLLPINHMKRMIHAAQLHKIKKIILPEDNRVHWDELPQALKQGIKVHFVNWFYEIADIVFKVDVPKPSLGVEGNKESAQAASKPRAAKTHAATNAPMMAEPIEKPARGRPRKVKIESDEKIISEKAISKAKKSILSASAQL